jgi:hypothetical protein
MARHPRVRAPLPRICLISVGLKNVCVLVIANDPIPGREKVF